MYEDGVCVRTRNGRDITHAVPECRDLSEALLGQAVVLDDDLVAGAGRPAPLSLPLITAALFLAESIDDRPWAHLDIAGPGIVAADDSWRSRGGGGFGARLLATVAELFTVPTAPTA